MKNTYKGILMAIIGASAYGFLPIITKQLLLFNVNSNDILISRFILIALFLGVYLGTKGQLKKPTARQVGDLVIFAAFGYGGAILLLTESFRYLPVSQASVIHFSYPLFVALLMVVFFKEKMTKLKLLALGMTTISLIFFIGTDFRMNFIGVSIALISGFAFGAYLTSINQSSLKNFDVLHLMFYLSMAVVVVFGSIEVLKGRSTLFTYPTPAYGYMLLLTGVSVIGIAFVTIAIRQIGETYTAMLSLFEPIVAYLCSIFIFSEPLTLSSIMGSIMMIFVVFAILLDEYLIEQKSNC